MQICNLEFVKPCREQLNIKKFCPAYLKKNRVSQNIHFQIIFFRVSPPRGTCKSGCLPWAKRKRKLKKAWHDLLFVPRPLLQKQMPRPLYQGSSSFLWMQFNNNAVILDSKIKKLIQNLVIHSNEKKNWWSKKNLWKKKFKNQTKNIVKMTEALTQTNKRTHKKWK